jgi:hypothetical protein
MSHTCHARACKVPVPPKLLMCPKHWKLVPRLEQAQVWAHYRPGQEIDKTPTKKYLDAADAAIRAVAQKEGSLNRPKQEELF